MPVAFPQVYEDLGDNRVKCCNSYKMLTILSFLLGLYSAVMSTYNFIDNKFNDNCGCNNSIMVHTDSPNINPIPTESTTKTPSITPTNNAPEYNIGDFKVSSISQDHDKWFLCNGSVLDTNLYPKLFQVIGYKFGGSGNNFNLPDATNKIIGLNGDKYNSQLIGNEITNITLTTNMLPSHSHVSPTHYHAVPPHTHSVVVWETIQVNGGLTEITGAGVACEANPIYNVGCEISTTKSQLENNIDISTAPQTNTGTYSGGNTGYTGSGDTFGINTMQPTLFIGNLFIYGD